MKDLGVSPLTFPMIGEFGCIIQIGDGRENLQVDSNLNVRYIAADNAEVAEILYTPAMDTEIDEEVLGPEALGIDGGAYILQTAVRQPPGECDPESDLI